MFSMQSVSRNPFIATFQFSSAASLNLGRSQNDVLGNGLMKYQATELRLGSNLQTKNKSFALYTTIPGFKNPGHEALIKHYRKRRKCWKPAFSLFHTIFSFSHNVFYSTKYKFCHLSDL